MARHVLILTACALAVTASGCLRFEFDLCAEPNPHPDCELVDASSPIDAGADAAMDSGAPARDASPDDEQDAGTDASARPDASPDAGASDAGASDAGTSDAGASSTE